MSITVSLLQDGTNSHKETVDKFNAWATKLFSSDGIVPNGSIVDATPDTGDFALQANGTPDMSLDVLAGSALVTGTPTSGVSQRVLVTNSATIDDGITIAANSTGGTRYDWIYIKLDPDKMKDPASGADDVATIYTSRSTSSTTDDGTPPTYGLNIAVVTVANGASSITNANISDTRVFAIQLPAGNPYKARAYLASNQTINDNTATKITLDTESYDPNNNFDSTTNYRYTAPVTGYYQVNALAQFYNSNSRLASTALYLYKNGASIAMSQMLPSTAYNGVLLLGCISDVVYLSAGDYLELYGYADTVDSSNSVISGGSTLTYLSVHLLSV